MTIVSSIHPNFYIIFEILSFVFFVVILAREIYQKNARRVIEILSCLVFGMILEIGDTYLAHTYYYSPDFLVKIFDVPLAIGFAWALVIYCVMLLSDQYNIPWPLRPFMDALTAVIFDLAIDAVAIRLGFWHWAIPLDGEWYGVPFENLVGWIFVVLSFSFVARYLRTLNLKRLLSRVFVVFGPVFAYAGLAAGLIFFSAIAVLPYAIDNWSTLLSFNYRPNINVLYNPRVQLWKVIFFVAIMVELINVTVWSAIKYRRNYIMRFDLLSFAFLSAFHLFLIAAVFITGMYRETPMLAVVGIGMFLVNCTLHLLPYLLLRPKVIYIFRGVERSLVKEEKKVAAVVRKSLG